MDTPTGLKHFVSFRSSLFSTEARRHYINSCCFCEDLAHWLNEKLAVALPSMNFTLHQEEVGWVLDLCPDGRPFTIRVVAQTTESDDDKITNWFGVYVADQIPGLIKRMFAKTDASLLVDSKRLVIHEMDAALRAESGIRQIEWWAEGFAVGQPTSSPGLRRS
jgi:hypothetical protein